MNRGNADKHGRMWRVIRWSGARVCVAIALGATTTVAVCWGCAAFASEPTGIQGTLMAVQTTAGVFEGSSCSYYGLTQLNWNDSDAERIKEIRALAAAAGRPFQDRAPYWSFVRDPIEAARMYAVIGKSRGDWNVPGVETIEIATGWPCSAMVSRYSREFFVGLDMPFYGDLVCASGIDLPSDRTKGATPRGLPLSPVWPGFLIDTVLASGAWFGVLLGPAGVRARLRSRRGLCRACGYSLHGLPLGVPCPECGAAARSAEAHR